MPGRAARYDHRVATRAEIADVQALRRAEAVVHLGEKFLVLGWRREVPHEPVAEFLDGGNQLSRDLLRNGIDEASGRQVVVGNRKPGDGVIELSLELGEITRN